MERFYNATLQVIDTTIDISDNPAIFEVVADGLPVDPNYIIKIGSEYLRVTGVDISGGSPYQYTAARGLEGSSAATHTIGSTVVHIISADGLTKILEEQNHHVDTIETALIREGRVQNVDQRTVVENSGSYIHHFVDRYRISPIDFGDYTVLNTDSTNSDVENSILRLKRETPTNAGYTLFAVTIGGDFTTSYKIGIQLARGANASDEIGVGIGVYDSSNDKHIVATHNISNSAPYIFNKIESFNTLTTLDVTNVAALAAYPASILFLKVTIDGTNAIFYYSYDNIVYVELGSVAETYLTVDTFVIALSPHAVANIFHVGA